MTRRNGEVALISGTARGQGRAAALRAEPDSVRLAAWPRLARSRGCIRTVGSTTGLTGSLADRLAPTRQLAAEGVPHGIRANGASPGMLGTPGPAPVSAPISSPISAPTSLRCAPSAATSRSAASAALTRPRTSRAPISSSTAAGPVLPGATPRKDSPA
ncbi:hypothetical protein [Streptomyces sp. NPDC002779]|uniref:hypothetical protein n=1 Tax=Streptomyces sp. NPDC002779 TaxID=3364664 RepID=UPI0036A1190C